MREGFESTSHSGLMVENRAWHEAAFSADRREGIAAFNGRASPQWPCGGRRVSDDHPVQLPQPVELPRRREGVPRCRCAPSWSGS